MSTIALATDTNINVLDGLYKTRQQQALTFSGPQIAKELDSWEDIVPVIITEVVDSEFGFLPSQALQERESEEANEFLGQLIDLAMCSDRMS